MARTTRRAALLLPLAAAGAAPARAQAPAFPTRAITLVVPYAPGGPVDTVGRAAADALRRQLGQAVVVENRSGAGGLLGTRHVAAARPDGHTLLLGSSGPLVIAPSADPSMEDPLRQLAPVGLVAESPQLLGIPASLPVRTMAEFVAYGRARPAGLNMGSAGVGTTPHLAIELLKATTGLAIEHIPYRGTGAALADLVAGKIDGAFGDIAALLPLVAAGQLRALAITGPARAALAPDIPTAAEAGFPRQQTSNWQALLAPAGTPAPVVARLSEALGAMQGDEAYRALMARGGAVPTPSSPEHLAAMLAAEREAWGPLIRTIGLRLD